VTVYRVSRLSQAFYNVRSIDPLPAQSTYSDQFWSNGRPADSFVTTVTLELERDKATVIIAKLSVLVSPREGLARVWQTTIRIPSGRIIVVAKRYVRKGQDRRFQVTGGFYLIDDEIDRLIFSRASWAA
jgi:hypothetical protein